MSLEPPTPDPGPPPPSEEEEEVSHGVLPGLVGSGAAPEEEVDPTHLAAVRDFLAALEKAVRAHRLYQANNPAYHGFIDALREAATALWTHAGAVQLAVEEEAFRWRRTALAAGEGRESLPFLFYKDGVRHLAFEDGFEEEMEAFLTVVHRARALDSRSQDDMVTLLWEADLAHVQYGYVDMLLEGLELPEGGGPVLRAAGDTLELSLVTADVVGEAGGELAPAVAAGAPPVVASIRREDFRETLYFLDPDEMRQLEAEVGREMERDVRTDVLNALFDRLEDPLPGCRPEILRILRQVLPAFLGRGDLASATLVLEELAALLEKGTLGEEERAEAERLYAELNEPTVLRQLMDALLAGSIAVGDRELEIFLAHLGPAALPQLLRATETAGDPLAGRLRGVVDGLTRSHPEALVELVRAEDPEVATGALRAAGRLELTTAVAAVAARLGDPDPVLRRAAVEALAGIRSAPALDAIQRTLEDADRSVRIAAARALTGLRYAAARARLAALLESRQVKEADLTEKIAFFEAFGAVADAAGVATLDRLLNGRKLFAKEQAELRACAAMALGRVRAPAARTALEKAAEDAHPVVRNAVARALRGETGEGG